MCREIEKIVYAVKEELENQTVTVKRDLEKMKIHGPTLTPRISGNKAKTPNSEGQTSFETYKLQFEAASKPNRWSEKEKATALVVALRERACDLLRTVPSADKNYYSTILAPL